MKTSIPIFCTAAVLSFLTITVRAQDNPAPPAAAAATDAPAQTEMQKWIATTDAQWQATFKRDVTDVHEADLKKVMAQYLSALDEGIKKASAANDLKGALALRNEQTRFGDTNVFLEKDEEGDAAPVKAVRAAIRVQLAQSDAKNAARAKALHAKYDQVLTQAQTQLTKAQRLDDAQIVQTKRDEVKAAWITALNRGAFASPPAVSTESENQAPSPIADGQSGKLFLGKSWYSRAGSEYHFKKDGTGYRLQKMDFDTSVPFTWRQLPDGIVEVLQRKQPTALASPTYFRFVDVKTAYQGDSTADITTPVTNAKNK